VARPLLDLTRTLARASRLAPGSIDRVERAWTRRLAADPAARFLISAGPRHVLLDGAGALALSDALEGREALPPADLRAAFSPWRTERQRRGDSLARRLAVAQGDALSALLASEGGSWTYLNLAQAQLDARRLADLRAGGVVRAVAMLHDLVALERPDLARPAEPTRLLGVLAAAELCDAVAYASPETAALAEAHMERAPPAVVAPPGLTPLPAPGPAALAPAATDGFVMLGALEPRRNHLSMLWIWQRLWQELGEAAPKLFILGRRAVGSDTVQDALERAPMAGRAVFERRDLPDAEVAAHLANARALLAPSHAEASGLPAAEALALGCPVIAADLPAFRAVGGDAPDYLDPLDLPAWIEQILAYAAPPAEGPDPRAAQLARLADWRAPGWDAHFAAVEALLDPARAPAG